MKRLYGILYAMGSAAAFGFMPVFAKIAQMGGAGTVSVVFFRFSLAALVFLLYFRIKKIDIRISKKQLARIACMGVFGSAATSLTLYLSYKYIALGLATTLHFIYPAVVAVLSFVLYRERLGPVKIFSLVLSVAGLYILVGFGASDLSAEGTALALISGLFYAFYVLEAGHQEIKRMDGRILAFYICVFASAGTFLYGTVAEGLGVRMELSAMLAIAGIALLCTVFALFAFLKAVQLIGPSNSAVLSTLEPITGILLGALFFGEKFTATTLIGSVFVILSVALFVLPAPAAAGDEPCQSSSDSIPHP